jgi:hypothetical protein
MIRITWKQVVGGLVLAAQIAVAQLPSRTRVSPRNMYERLVTVVPIIGSGTYADPKRPMYAPLPSQMNPTSRKGILAYSSQTSDDGKYALVEFVAQDQAAFKDIIADTAIKHFRKGKDKPADIVTELQKYKKDFDFNHFGVVRLP